MDNYQCLDYASVALYNLQKEGKEVTIQSLRAEMVYLMDMHSEKEIKKKYAQINIY